MVVSECNVVVAQTLSYPTQLATRHRPPSPQNSDTRVYCRRAFSALCALQTLLIGFFSVEIDVGSTGISRHFLIELECRWHRGGTVTPGPAASVPRLNREPEPEQKV